MDFVVSHASEYEGFKGWKFKDIPEEEVAGWFDWGWKLWNSIEQLDSIYRTCWRDDDLVQFLDDVRIDFRRGTFDGASEGRLEWQPGK